MKTSLLAMVVLGVAVAACSGTSNPSGPGGAGGEEEVTTSTGSMMSSSSSGMGGTGGNGTGGGGAGGGAPAPKADKLGQVCNAMTPCPMGYVCVALDAMAGGFCTIPCGGQMDMTTCTAANGFPGPGTGQCALGAKDSMGMVTSVCGIFCGALVNPPSDMCPTGLTCRDKFDATGMPGTDGKNDICVP